MDDKIDACACGQLVGHALFQQLLEDGFTVEQAADLAYNEING